MITFSSLYGEYVVRFFFPDGVFLLCDHGLVFAVSLCENSINQSKQSDVMANSNGPEVAELASRCLMEAIR